MPILFYLYIFDILRTAHVCAWSILSITHWHDRTNNRPEFPGILVFAKLKVFLTCEVLYMYQVIKVCRQRRKTFLLLCCLFFFSFISFPLSAFCDFSAIFHRISLIFGQLVEQLYTFWGTKDKGQGHKVTLDENAYSAISVIYHPIVFKFSSLIVLDKGTTFCKFQGHRLKVKVTKRQPWKYVVRLFLSYFWTNFCEIWLVYRKYLVHQPYEFSGPYAKCHGHSETK